MRFTLPSTRTGRPFARRLPVVAGLASALVLGLSAHSTARVPSGPGPSTSATATSTWVQVFDDEFSGTSLDTSHWGVYTGGSRRAANVVVHDGMVTLQTRRTSTGWTSAGLTSARSLVRTYGKYVIKARLDAAQGTRAVALLWPTGGIWPPEVDFFEDSGEDAARTCNLTANHYLSSGVHKIQQAPVTSDYTGWHRIGVIWASDHLSYLLDGVVVATVTGHVPQHDMWLGLQTAIGTGSGAPDASTPDVVDFDVDWVRVYAQG